ncbi:hypothetical protein FE392_13125 [Xenorhabdus sp. 12]|uniref:Transposase n=1 Tax=Xenorhabdus santafensis TaxID=2582833 RepID=A0ABU4SBS1_9GAMM|nr:hypothetical protein [Xenorhabdus sp. 12]
MLKTIAEQLEQKGYAEGFMQGIEQSRKEGFEQGFKQGRLEGLEQGKLETAHALLQLGVSLDIIVTSTGLSRDKIEALTD